MVRRASGCPYGYSSAPSGELPHLPPTGWVYGGFPDAGGCRTGPRGGCGWSAVQSGTWRVDGGQRKPVIPRQVPADVPGVGERPSGGDPLRYQRVQCPLQAGAGLAVGHPPGDLGVSALLFRRVNVDTAEQGCFGVVEQCVVEGQVSRRLGLATDAAGWWCRRDGSSDARRRSGSRLSNFTRAERGGSLSVIGYRRGCSPVPERVSGACVPPPGRGRSRGRGGSDRAPRPSPGESCLGRRRARCL
jgi:hypothetical protein